jgi:RHH-type rel operon transcriptional repressor/antitoxin RelB
MAAIQIPPEIDSQIEEVANRTGESRDDLVREALVSYLEDRQDALRAAERLKNVGTRISLEEIGRKYGLAS